MAPTDKNLPTYQPPGCAWLIGQRSNGRFYIELPCCPKPHKPDVAPGGRCQFSISMGPADAAQQIWHYDGNKYEPTITPSIQCQDCGLHVFVSRGVIS